MAFSERSSLPSFGEDQGGKEGVRGIERAEVHRNDHRHDERSKRDLTREAVSATEKALQLLTRLAELAKGSRSVHMAFLATCLTGCVESDAFPKDLLDQSTDKIKYHLSLEGELGAETSAEKVERVDGLFDAAAEQVRNSEVFQQEFSNEHLDELANTLESFDSGEMFGQLSELSGLDLEEVAGHSTIKGVAVYSDATLEQVFDAVQSDLTRQKDSSRSLDDQLDSWKYSQGTYQHGYIFLNLSEITHDNSPTESGELLEDVVNHEALHSFDGSSFSGVNTFSYMYEGMVEYSSQTLHGDHHFGGDDVGYRDGAVASAAILHASLGDQDQVFWRSLIQGNPDLLVDTFSDLHQLEDQSDGDRALEGALLHAGGAYLVPGSQKYSDSSGAQKRYNEIAPGMGILDILSDDASEIVERANGLLPDAYGTIVYSHENNVADLGLVSADGGELYAAARHEKNNDGSFSFASIDNDISTGLNSGVVDEAFVSGLLDYIE